MKVKAFIALVPLALLVGCGSSSGGGAVSSPAAVTNDSLTAPSDTDPVTSDPAPAPEETVNSSAVAFAAWWNGGGSKIFSTLGADLTDLGQAGTAGDSAAVESAAVTLKADVDNAQQYAPMPDAATQTEWAAALAGSGEAATDYITGAANMDASEIEAGTAALLTSTSHIKVVNAFIDRMTAG